MENEKMENLEVTSSEEVEQTTEEINSDLNEIISEEVVETNEESVSESETETVSDGDAAIPYYDSALSSDILEELIKANGNLEIIVECKETEALSLWEKPLSEYNTMEGIGLVTLLTVIAVVIFKVIGGIITCSL